MAMKQDEQEVVVVTDIQDIKHLFIEEQARDRNGIAIAPMKSLLDLAKAWVNATNINVASDNAANGVAIVTYSLAAGKTLVITKLKQSATASQVISVGYGDIAVGAPTAIDHTFLNAPQQWGEYSDGPSPIMAFFNNTAAAINIYIYAATGAAIMGVVNNPAAGVVSYGGTIGGFIF